VGGRVLALTPARLFIEILSRKKEKRGGAAKWLDIHKLPHAHTDDFCTPVYIQEKGRKKKAFRSPSRFARPFWASHEEGGKKRKKGLEREPQARYQSAA